MDEVVRMLCFGRVLAFFLPPAGFVVERVEKMVFRCSWVGVFGTSGTGGLPAE